MASGAKALNSKIWYSDDSGTTYTVVANVTQVARPTPTKADIDITHLTSTAKEYEKDVPDYSTVSFAFNYESTVTIHQTLLALESSGAVGQWKLELPEAGASTVYSAVFQATVDSVDISAAMGGKQEATLNLRVTGGVTNAHAATAQT